MPSREALALLRLLVDHMRSGSVRSDDPNTFLSYAQAHSRLGLPMMADTVGNSLKRQGLQELAEWAKHERLPAVTGLVIDREKLHPGDGYYELHGRPNTDWRWWFDEVARAVAFDWTPHLRGA